MEYEGVALHNVAELKPRPCGGVRFQRVPETVRLGLNPHAQERMLDVVGTEIRFVINGEAAEVHLHALCNTMSAQVFFGDFRVNTEHVVGAEPMALRVEYPRSLLAQDARRLGPLSFSPRVCRVFLARGCACFHGVSGDVRAPRPDELPALRYLAYGTSITQGAGASLRHLCYVSQTATRLRADAINLGCASSAHCEAAMADHIASRRDWHFCTLALSTNMGGFPLPEFSARVRYMVEKAADAPGARPVACITLWPKGGDLRDVTTGETNAGATPEDYRQALRDVVAASKRPNVHLLEGRDLLPEFRGLSPDLLHPSDYGHTIMAERLAARLKTILDGHAQAS
jgi:hypothetical protein